MQSFDLMLDPNYKVRAMDIADYPEVVALWQRSEGVGLSESDTLEGVGAFLRRNPRLSAVAESSAGEIPEAATFWTHNGWTAPTWQVMQKQVDAQPLGQPDRSPAAPTRRSLGDRELRLGFA